MTGAENVGAPGGVLYAGVAGVYGVAVGKGGTPGGLRGTFAGLAGGVPAVLAGLGAGCAESGWGNAVVPVSGTEAAGDAAAAGSPTGACCA